MDSAALLGLGVPGFGLHPALEPLLPLWREGTLAFVHAVGSPDATRSHFDAQDYLELGTPGRKDTRDGFLSRALRGAGASPAAAVGPAQRTGSSPAAAVAIAERLPRCLQGDVRALAFASLDQLRLRAMAGAPRGPRGRDLSRIMFEALYESSDDAPLAASGKEAFEAVELLEGKLAGFDPRSPSAYPPTPPGRSLRLLAALINADVGLRVGFADASGWDTHAAQPAVLARGLSGLAHALAAFRADLGPRIDDVVLVAATEFGRTVRQNGAMGTDHGHGSVAFVLGGRVAGGRIHGRWPGLADDQLYEARDLAVTTDLRSVFAAALAAQLGATDAFPGFAGSPLTQLIRV
jgi:uncharacterized protein (DUF1501 family)